MIASAITSTTVKTTAPWLSRMFLPSAGIRAAIEVKIRIDMPLPMPRSVIISPIHMIAAVPAVMASTRVISANALWSGMIWSLTVQPGNIWPFSASARNAVDCRMPSPIVRYRVYWVSLAWPAWPSFLSCSNLGITTVSSCTMIEAVMYGMMPSANTLSRSSAPPENRLSTVNRSLPVPASSMH